MKLILLFILMFLASCINRTVPAKIVVYQIRHNDWKSNDCQYIVYDENGTSYIFGDTCDKYKICDTIKLLK